MTGTAPAARREGLARGVLFGVFFGSGFASLLYQVVWHRVLAIFFISVMPRAWHGSGWQ